jgi:hypothetical protein
MAKETVYSCDKCKKRKTCIEVPVSTYRHFDGVESSDWVERVDICVDCAGAELRKFLNGLSYEEGSRWFDSIKKGY